MTTPASQRPRAFVSLVSFASFVSLVSFVLTSAPRNAGAQSFESVGLRAQGMGGAYLAVADDATATWWNPAGLATGAYFNALVEYDKPRSPADTSIKGVAISFPALGLSYYRLPINQMRSAGSTGTDGGSREDQGVLSVFGATAGQSVGNHFVLGSTLKLVRAGDTHGDLDLGAMAKFGAARLGLVVKNIRKPSLETDSGPLELKRQARAGATLIGHSNGIVGEISVAVDADLTTTPTRFGDQRQVAAGLEALTFGKKLGLRFGFSGNTVGERGSAVSGGASLIISQGAYVRSYVDGQLTGGSEESRRGWGVGLRVTF